MGYVRITANSPTPIFLLFFAGLPVARIYCFLSLTHMDPKETIPYSDSELETPRFGAGPARHFTTTVPQLNIGPMISKSPKPHPPLWMAIVMSSWTVFRV